MFFEEVTDSLLAETLNVATIDLGCTKTVCGKSLAPISVSHGDKEKNNIYRSNNSFEFDNSKIIRSDRLVTIPVFIDRIQAKLTIDVIDYEIPLLPSKDSMEMAIAIIGFKNDKMIMFPKTVDVIPTDSGHYDVLLNNFIKKDEFVNHQIS